MISVDNPEDNQRFHDEKEADFDMLSDPGKQVAEAYGVLPPVNPARPDAPQYARRWTFFIGPDGKILHVETAGHTTDAGDFMVKKLTELGVKKK